MATTAAEHLADINAAITDIVAGRASSYSINSRSATKHDLPKLFDIRRALQSEADRASRGVFRPVKLRGVR